MRRKILLSVFRFLEWLFGEISWQCELIADSFDDELLDKLRKAIKEPITRNLEGHNDHL